MSTKLSNLLSKMSSDKKIIVGMCVLAVAGLCFGGAIGYLGVNAYMSNKVLNDMTSEGYVLTSDATATADDIVNGKTAYVDGQLIEGTVDALDTSDATATSDVIVQGKTAYVNGELVIGTLEVNVGTTITPTTTAQRLSGGFYLSGDLVVEGSLNLISSNIKKGVTIFNVTGTYEGEVETTTETDTTTEGGE